MKTQKCKNCAHYSPYYKKWSASFGMLNHGYCAKHKKPQTQRKTCDKFKSGEQIEQRREERLLKCLEQSLDSINEIAQILKEKYYN